tara:strand:- start:22358 stop:22792 length:435 start_codon:yes stop_codon:yes gene_type:complete
MLEELSKRDKEWRKIALKITGNKQTADEVVQEMYLTLSTSKNRVFNTSYVSYCMYHTYLRMIKAEKKITSSEVIDYVSNIEQVDGLDDEQRARMDIFNSLPWYQQEIMKEYQDFSIRQIQSKFNINRGFIFDTIKSVKNKVKNG